MRKKCSLATSATGMPVNNAAFQPVTVADNPFGNSGAVPGLSNENVPDAELSVLGEIGHELGDGGFW